MLGEHLGSPLRFPLLEFVLLFHIFHQFYIGRGRPGCLPNLMITTPILPLSRSPAWRFISLTLTLLQRRTLVFMILSLTNEQIGLQYK